MITNGMAALRLEVLIFIHAANMISATVKLMNGNSTTPIAYCSGEHLRTSLYCLRTLRRPPSCRMRISTNRSISVSCFVLMSIIKSYRGYLRRKKVRLKDKNEDCQKRIRIISVPDEDEDEGA